MTYDLANRRFTVPELTDLSLVGIYTFILRSEISVPDDHTMSRETLMSQEEEITVMVNPCQVTDYSLTSAIASIEYEVGSPGLTDGYYVFDESPACNYQETVTVTNLPDFMSHDEMNSEFTISQVNDLSKIGSYIITVKSEIQIPTDANRSAFTTM